LVYFDFKDTNLGRVDLCYDRKLKASDKDLNFFSKILLDELIAKKITEAPKSVIIFYELENNRVLIVFRIYMKLNGRKLRFEIELKKTVIKNF
jgi:hypothetical protein